MKQPKKLSRSQKSVVSNNCLNAIDWMLVDETDFYLKIINKDTGKTKMITKFPQKRR